MEENTEKNKTDFAEEVTENTDIEVQPVENEQIETTEDISAAESAEEIPPAPVKKKSILKKILITIGIIFGALLALIVLAIIFINPIVKNIVPPVASKILKVQVEIDNFDLKLFSGSVTIGGVRIHNPKGYDTPYAFELGKFYVKVDVASVFSDKIIIEDITIEQMNASLEFRMRSKNLFEDFDIIPYNNLSEISDNIKGKPVEPTAKTAGEATDTTQDSDDAEKTASTDNTAAEKSDPAPQEVPEENAANDTAEEKKTDTPPAKQKKLIIRKLALKNCSFTVQGIKIPFPDVTVTDIGDGKPLGDFAEIVYDEVMNAVFDAYKASLPALRDVADAAKKAGKELTDYAKNQGEKIYQDVKNRGLDAVESIKQEGEKNIRDAKEKLKGLFKR